MDSKTPDDFPRPEPAEPPNQYKSVGRFSISMTYVKSFHGIVTAIITVVSLIALICVQSAGIEIRCFSYLGVYSFFGFVSGTAFLTDLIHYIIYILTFQERFKFIPWNIADLIFCGLWTLLYFISSILMVTMSCGSAGIVAGAIFGFGALVAMAMKGYHAYKKYRGDLDHAQTTQGIPDQEYLGGLSELPPPPYHP